MQTKTKAASIAKPRHSQNRFGRLKPAFSSNFGSLFIGDCLPIIRALPDESLDLVITSPPYDGQPKYSDGERYDRAWYEGFFLDVTDELRKKLKPHGSFVLNYRSKRHGNERGTLQYEVVFWLRKQGYLFCEDFIWGRPSLSGILCVGHNMRSVDAPKTEIVHV